MAKLINNGENVEVKLDVGTDAGQCHKFLGDKVELVPSRSDLCISKGICMMLYKNAYSNSA